MKFLFFVCMMVFSISLYGQRSKIVFEKVSHDFGEIYQKKGPVECTFKYRNDGDAPLILTNVRAGCGCTTPEWNRKPLMPGEMGSIQIFFDPRAQHLGIFRKSISVLSNAENSMISLVINGIITEKDPDPFVSFEPFTKELKIATKSLNFGNIMNTAEVVRTFDLLNVSTQTLTLSATSTQKCITTEINPVQLAPGKLATVTITYKASLRKEFGMVSDEIVITSKPGGSENMEIRANLKEDFEKTDDAPKAEFSSKGTDLGTISQNMTLKREITLFNRGDSDLIIRKITPSDATISASSKSMIVKPGKSVPILINIKTGNKPGKKISSVIFIVNDPTNSIHSYKITGEIR